MMHWVKLALLAGAIVLVIAVERMRPTLLKPDNVIEQMIEEEIKEELHIDVDLSPEEAK
jgi:hypothetical protein